MMELNKEGSQFAKADSGKAPISLVPPEIMRAIATIRNFGVEKYHAPNNWVVVDKQRWVDAMLRHLLSYIEGETIDEESGFPHIWHAACNMAFIIEMEKDNWPEIKKRMIESDPELRKKFKDYIIETDESYIIENDEGEY